PLVLRHELGLSADQAVGQGPQLFDQPDIVVARAKVETPLENRSGRDSGGAPSGGGRRINWVSRIQPIVQLPAGLGAEVDVGILVLWPALPGVGDRRRDSITRQMVREVAADPQLVVSDPVVRYLPLAHQPMDLLWCFRQARGVA